MSGAQFGKPLGIFRTDVSVFVQIPCHIDSSQSRIGGKLNMGHFQTRLCYKIFQLRSLIAAHLRGVPVAGLAAAQHGVATVFGDGESNWPQHGQNLSETAGPTGGQPDWNTGIGESNDRLISLRNEGTAPGQGVVDVGEDGSYTLHVQFRQRSHAVTVTARRWGGMV